MGRPTSLYDIKEQSLNQGLIIKRLARQYWLPSLPLDTPVDTFKQHRKLGITQRNLAVFGTRPDKPAPL